MKTIFNLFDITRDFKRLIAFESFVQIIDHFLEGTSYSRSIFGLCVSFLQQLNQQNTDPVYLSYAFLFDYLKWQGLPIQAEICAFCGNPWKENRDGYSIGYEEGGIICPKCAQARSLFNPVTKDLVLLLQDFSKNKLMEEEKRNKVFFQNWEDLDRIVKDYYKCRFNKKLQTFISLKKM